MDKLNDDALEAIFSHLDFRSLDAAERVCKRWKELIGDRRLYWQLTKRICRGNGCHAQESTCVPSAGVYTKDELKNMQKKKKRTMNL